MITINIDTIEDVDSFEFVVAGKRRITFSINEKNLSLSIPDGVNPESIHNTEHSFFLRTKDVA